MPEFVWRGVEVTNQITAAANLGLHDAAEAILTEANRHVPHDEGTLERSGQVTMSEGGNVAVVSYDGPYAVRLHERPEYKFQDAPQRGGKWLENAIKKLAGTIPVIIGMKVKNKLGGH